jgi:Skp family chaperone for outer membrane proteins
LNLKRQQRNFQKEKKIKKRKKEAKSQKEVEAQIQSIEEDTDIKIPFDMIFMKYIFMNSTNFEIRTKALEVLITHFN